MAKNQVYSSGMRGEESAKKYHPNQAETVEENAPVGKQSGSKVDGVTETPNAFKTGMRGSEAAPNPLESEVDKETPTVASLGLPAGSEIIGSDKTHHTVRIPIGGGKKKAAK